MRRQYIIVKLNYAYRSIESRVSVLFSCIQLGLISISVIILYGSFNGH